MRIRPDTYFMKIVNVVKERSTCLRRQTGAIIVRDMQVISIGYNGAPTKLSHCDEAGCLRERLNIPSGEREELCRGSHAEQGAIDYAARYGIATQGTTIYCTTFPCASCAKSIVNAGIVRVVYQENYPQKKLSVSILRDVELNRFSENVSREA